MRFGISQEIKFGTNLGTYSAVTDREFYDSQITATDEETTLLLDHFGEANIAKGSVSSNPEMAAKNFRLFPAGEVITLNLIFPKPAKSELRLYISSKAGFKPPGGHIWFLFLREGEIWIGSMSESEWRTENSILIHDDLDSLYQDTIIEGGIKTTMADPREILVRDRAVALHVFNLSSYQCEFNPDHQLFLSRTTGRPYLEAHHLVPMSLQKCVPVSLDNIHNVYCLCPMCHRAVHHAELPLRKQIIDVLIDKRSQVLAATQTSIGDIYNMYSVENINP